MLDTHFDANPLLFWEFVGIAADAAFKEGRVNRARMLLSQVPPEYRDFVWKYRSSSISGFYMTLKGHSYSARALAISKCGNFLASRSNDGLIYIWDANLGYKINCLNTPQSKSRLLKFSTDASMLFFSNGKSSVCRIHTKSGSFEELINDANLNISTAIMSESANKIIYGTSNGEIGIFDVESKKVQFTLTAHENEVQAIALSLDDNYLVSGSFDEIKIWELVSEKLIYRHIDDYFSLNSIAISPDSKYIAVATIGKCVKLYAFPKFTFLRNLDGHKSSVNHIEFSPDGGLLFSCSDDFSINTWGVLSGKLEKAHRGHTARVFKILPFPDGNRFASCSDDKTVKVWSQDSLAEILTFYGHSDSIISIDINNSSKLLASGSKDSTIKLWSLESFRFECELGSHDDVIMRVQFSPDGQCLVSASGGLDNGYDANRDFNTLKVWDLNDASLNYSIKTHSSWITGLSFSLDSKLLCSGSFDGYIKIWDMQSKSTKCQLLIPEVEINTLTFTLCGMFILFGCSDGSVRTWNYDKHAHSLILMQSSSSINSLAISPDGNYFASVNDFNDITIWDLIKQEVRFTWSGHDAVIRNARFSPDNKHLVTVSDDCSIIFWNYIYGSEQLRLTGHDDMVIDACFDRNTSFLATCSADKTIKIWDASNIANTSNIINEKVLNQEGIDVVSQDAKIDIRTEKYRISKTTISEAKNLQNIQSSVSQYSKAFCHSQIVVKSPKKIELWENFKKECSDYPEYLLFIKTCDSLLSQNNDLQELLSNQRQWAIDKIKKH